MIGDERVEEREDIDETEGREKRAAEKERDGEGPAPAGAVGIPNECGEQRDGGGEDEPRKHLGRVGHDTGVDETEVEREKKFAEIKPDGAAREQEALRGGEGEVGTLSADERVLERCRGDGGEGTADEPREQRDDVAAEGERAALPPREHEQGRGERGGDGFREQCGDEKCGGEGVSPGRSGTVALPRRIEAQIGERGAEIADEGERVFLFGDPRDGFDPDRVEREEQRGERGAGDGEAEQECGEEAGGEEAE